jgi:ribosomal protein S16
MVQENRFSIDAERAKYWLSVGAKPTDRVRKLMKLASIEGV